MTTYWIAINKMKITTPITNSPPTTKSPKAWMTLPAASSPSWPYNRISRVDEMLSARRSKVNSSSNDG